MLCRQAILKTKGDSEKIQQTFLPLVKEQKQRIPGRSRCIYIIDHIIARGRERERESLSAPMSLDVLSEPHRLRRHHDPGRKITHKQVASHPHQKRLRGFPSANFPEYSTNCLGSLATYTLAARSSPGSRNRV